jgi:hypothetical protein
VVKFLVKREIVADLAIYKSSGDTYRIVDQISVAACAAFEPLEQVQDAPAVIRDGHGI